MNLIELKNVAKYYKSEDNVSVGMKNISVAFNFMFMQLLGYRFFSLDSCLYLRN